MTAPPSTAPLTKISATHTETTHPHREKTMKKDSISEEFLRAICEDRRREGDRLEFKRPDGLPGTSEGDKKEFAKDVSAMANKEGGDIIYGIKEGEGEEEGIAKELEGISLEGKSLDAVERHLGNILNDWLEPRLPGVQYH